MHDRPVPSDAAEMERDIANLRRDDAQAALRAKRLGLPDWSDWWPTLEELRDGRSPSGASVALVVHSGGAPETWEDRSGYLLRSLASLAEHVDWPWTQRVIFSDWGPQPALAAIAQEHGYELAGPEVRLGYTNSMRALWKYLRKTDATHLFLTEDDFLIDRDVDIEAMASTLDAEPQLAQLALLRHPCYPAEMDPATILGHPRDAFTERRSDGVAWLEHRRFFTVNPTLIPRWLLAWPWPKGLHSEAVFGRSLFRYRKDVCAAFWGSGEPWISHIGEVRAATVY
jgi:hypothetical protein